MSARTVHYTEPPVPRGWEEFEACIVEINRLAPETFRRPSDGRKWKVCCDRRKTLALAFANFCDPDGSH